MPVLTYGNYTHPDNPAVTIEKSRRANPDGTKPYDHVSWTIRGLLSGYSTQANLLTAIGSLRTAYAANGSDLTLKQTAGGTTLESLTNASALHGVQITRPPALPEGQGPELYSLYHYEIVVEADVPASGTLTTGYDEEQTTSYETNDAGLITKTVRGRLRTPAGTSAEALFASKDPGAPAATYHLASKSKQLDGNDTSLDWSYTYQQGALAWPSGTYRPSVTETVETDESGRSIRTISGTFTGPNAAAQCRALRRGGLRLLSMQSSENPYDASHSVTYRYQEASNSRQVSFEQTVVLTGGGLDFVHLAALDGGDPVRQDTVQRPWTVQESGRLVSLDGYQTPPADPYPVRNRKPGATLTKSAPKAGADGAATQFETAWTRSYEFARNPGLKLSPVPSAATRDVSAFAIPR